MLYLPRDPTPSAVFFHTSRVDGALTHLLLLRVRIISVIFIYFVVMDSQCDAFSQVSIIGDAFKVYLTQCFVIICHSSVSEWLFNVPGVKLFSLLQYLLANAMLMFLAYCKAYCSRASQIFFGTGRYRFQYKTRLTV